LFNISILSQSNNLRFESLSVDDGLSQGSVFDILQDNYGFMWFATNDGLNRYDGYTFDIFNNDPNDSTSLPNNQVTSIDLDPDGNIWVGTNGGGLVKFNLDKKTFIKIPLPDLYKKDQSFSAIKKVLVSTDDLVWFACNKGNLFCYNPSNKSLTDYKIFYGQFEDGINKILSIYEDSKGNIWVGTLYKGVFHLNRKNGEIQHYSFEQYESMSSSNTINSITEDKNNIIWCATNEGICKINPATGEKRKNLLFDQFDKRGNKYPFEKTKKIVSDNKGNLWIATNGGGLIKFSTEKMGFSSYTYTPNDIYSIAYNTIQTLYFDNKGALWIGTNGKGISMLFPFTKNFTTIGEDKETKFYLSVSSIRTILEEDEKSFWVGGYYGLVLFNKETGIQYTVPYSEARLEFATTTNRLINRTVFSLLKDPIKPNRYLWIGTEGAGLIRFDRYKKKFRNFLKDNFEDDAFSYARIYALTESPDKKIWAGTQTGLEVIDPVTFSSEYYEHIPNNSNSLPEGKIMSIYFDSKGKCWIGTDISGFSIFDKEKATFKNYRFEQGKNNWLLSNTIYSFFEDSNGKYWLATGHGLHLFDPAKEEFVSFTDKNGLPNNVIYSVLEDEKGLLWMSTNNGLAQFDPTDKVFTNYSFPSGLQGNEFNFGAYYKDKNGNLYFGGTKGVTYFNPDEIQQNPYPPTVVLKNITITGDSVRELTNTESLSLLELNYDDDIVTFEFSALNYQSPQLNQYMYKVDGLNKNWIDLGNQRSVTFTNLPAGEYNLHVIASNNDDVWNEEGLQLTAIINPPFWATWWFITILILLVFAFLFLLYRFRVAIVQRQKAILEKVVRERTLDLQKSQTDLEKVNRAKDKLLSVIAHDMKNPFNSLLGYSEMLVKEFDILSAKEKKEALSGMATTSKAAYNLLENLLDWSRLQMDNIHIEKRTFNINALVEQNLRLASIAISDKHINIQERMSSTDKVYADEYMLNTVIRNLLMNSIKFTNDGGTITLSSIVEGNKLKVNVQDNGIGISEKQKEVLLRLEKVKSSIGTSGEKGTGLGLILCKEFIETNDGKLLIESELGKGSTFSFTVPLAE